MGQLLVRQLGDDVISRLKERAARNGRSVEAEHRQILSDALNDDEQRERQIERFMAEAKRFQAETAGRGGPTGTELIREDRDSR